MLTKMQKETGVIIDDLIAPCLPEEIEYLWDIYLDIRKGCCTVGYNDINSYINVSGNKLNFWESKLMLDLDILRNQSD